MQKKRSEVSDPIVASHEMAADAPLVDSIELPCRILVYWFGIWDEGQAPGGGVGGKEARNGERVEPADG